MLKLADISRTYKNKTNTVLALDNITLELPEKGFIAILGPSGCGKTTLLNILGLIDSPDSGHYIIDGISMDWSDKKFLQDYRRNVVTTVFQENHLFNDETVTQNISIVDEIQNSLYVNDLINILRSVELEVQADRFINELSGGQKQRVNIARSLIKTSSVFIADEPTGNLDEKTELLIFKLLSELAKTKLVILVTHNRNIANCYCNRIIELKDGNILFDISNTNKQMDSSIKIIENEIFISQDNIFNIDDWIIIKKLLFESKELKLTLKSPVQQKQLNEVTRPSNINIHTKAKPIYPKLSIDNFKRHIKNHIFITMFLSIIIAVAIIAYQTSCFDEAKLITDAFTKNHISEVVIKKNLNLFTTDYDDKITESTLSNLELDYTRLLNYNIEIERNSNVEYSILEQFNIFGFLYIDYSNLNLLHGTADSDDGILITDYTLRLLLLNDNYSTWSDVVGNYVNLGGVDFRIIGIVDTDYESYSELSIYQENEINLDAYSKRLQRKFEFERYISYSRIYINSQNNDSNIINQFVIGNLDYVVRLTDNLNGYAATRLKSNIGAYVSLELFNSLTGTDADSDIYVKYGEASLLIIGYVEDGLTDKYNIYVNQDQFSSISNEFFRPDEIILHEFNYDTINNLISTGYTHETTISDTLNSLVYVFKFISNIVLYIVGISFFLFLIFSSYYINNTIFYGNKKVGILLAFGIDRNDIYISNLIEFMIVEIMIITTSIVFTFLGRYIVNITTSKELLITIQTIQLTLAVFLYSTLLISVIFIVLIIQTTIKQLRKKIVVLIK